MGHKKQQEEKEVNPAVTEDPGNEFDQLLLDLFSDDNTFITQEDVSLDEIIGTETKIKKEKQIEKFKQPTRLPPKFQRKRYSQKYANDNNISNDKRPRISL